jgi:hypothetical protein
MSRKTLTEPETLSVTDATFIEPMECLATAKLPEGPQWVWEIKLDGYRAVDGLPVKVVSARYRGVFNLLRLVSIKRFSAPLGRRWSLVAL